MSEEKECKCCHEWWYASDIKQDLCPNYYDYFKQLKQQLAKKDKEIEEKMMSFEKRCQEYYKSDEFKRDFAIQELEKVKILLQNATNYEGYNVVGIYDAVNNQIRELKGEKDVED